MECSGVRIPRAATLADEARAPRWPQRYLEAVVTRDVQDAVDMRPELWIRFGWVKALRARWWYGRHIALQPRILAVPRQHGLSVSRSTSIVATTVTIEASRSHLYGVEPLRATMDKVLGSFANVCLHK